LENLSLSDINAIKSCNGSVSDAIFESEEYRNIGTVSEINESVTMASQELEAWKKEFGTREELDETLERLASLLEAYTEIGTPDEIENAINAAENALSGYREIGTIPDIVETLQRAERSLVGYTSLGDIVTVSEKLDRYDSMLEEYESKLREDKAMTLSGRYNIPVEKVASLLEKLSYEETVNFLEDFSSVASFSESVKPQYMSEDFSRQTRQDSGAARVFKRATRLIK
jgi:DNA repair ATPase RecN